MDKVFLNFDHAFEWPSSSKNEYENGTCLGAKTMLAILSNGQVTVCCLDSEGSINLGNVNKQSLHSILEGNHYRNILTGFQNNKCIETLCKECTYRNRFR